MSLDVEQHVTQLTPAAGGEALDAALLATLKGALRGNDDACRAASAVVLVRLHYGDSRVRVKALLACDWLMQRSRACRDAVVPRIQEVLAATLGANAQRLPKPQQAAERLHALAQELFASWAVRFGAHYPQLVVAHHQAAEHELSRPVDAIAERTQVQLRDRYAALVPQLPALFASLRATLAQVDATVSLFCSRGDPAPAVDDAHDGDGDWEDVAAEPTSAPLSSSPTPGGAGPGGDKAALLDALKDAMALLNGRLKTELEETVEVLTRVVTPDTARGDALRSALVLKAAVGTAMKTCVPLVGGAMGPSAPPVASAGSIPRTQQRPPPSAVPRATTQQRPPPPSAAPRAARVGAIRTQRAANEAVNRAALQALHVLDEADPTLAPRGHKRQLCAKDRIAKKLNLRR
jgi:hypothetical protein